MISNAANSRDVMLIVTCTADHNGAFKVDRNGLFDPLKKQYDIIFKRATTTDDLKNALKEVAGDRKISVLWIQGHGAPLKLRLGHSRFSNIPNPFYRSLATSLDGAFLNQSTLQNLDLNEHLTMDAKIILDSCETGKNVQKGMNLANSVAYSTKKKVYAAAESIFSTSMIVEQNKPLEVKFYVPLETTVKDVVFSVVMKIFYHIIYSIHQCFQCKCMSNWVKDVTYVADGTNSNFWPWPGPVIR